MLPTDQRLGRQDLPGPHVDLGLVVQHQGTGLDYALEMKLDVVAELTRQGHVIGEHRDLVPAGFLGRVHGLIGPAQQIGGGVPARNTQRDPDADCAREHLTVDGHPLPQQRLKPVRQRFSGIGVHR